MIKKQKNANAKNKRGKFSDDKIKKEQDFDLDLEGLKLEEDVETEEPDMTNIDLKNLEFNQFMEFPAESEKGSVALERMALSAPRPIFVGGIPQGIGAEESEDFKYSNTPGADEPKYSASPDSRMERAGRVDSGIRQDTFLSTNPDFLFQRVADSRLSSDSSMERVERARRFDAEKEGRMNMFEREEAKYKEYKPKVPE